MPEPLFQPGDQIDDRYRIEALIGEGGYGLIFRATQLSTGQQVAIKVLRPERLVAGPDDTARRVARFRREMQVIARLKHPNIVRLVDSGRLEDGAFYIVLDFIDGEPLSRLLWLEGPLAPEECKALMLQVADALCCAHTEGVVHRDLKPSNIMVTQTGGQRNALILDFGVASIFRHNAEIEDASRPITSSTGDGLRGTPAYMAPEQWMPGQDVAPQTDLYAFGLVMLESLTGQPAIASGSLQAIMLQQISDKPISIPEALEAHPLGQLLRACLEKSPNARPESAQALLNALRACPVEDLVPEDLVVEPEEGVSLDFLQTPATPVSKELKPEKTISGVTETADPLDTLPPLPNDEPAPEKAPPAHRKLMLGAGLVVLFAIAAAGLWATTSSSSSPASSPAAPQPEAATQPTPQAPPEPRPEEDVSAEPPTEPTPVLELVTVPRASTLIGIRAEEKNHYASLYPKNAFDLEFGLSVIPQQIFERPALEVMPREVTWRQWNAALESSSLGDVLRGFCPSALPQAPAALDTPVTGIGAGEAELFCVTQGMRLPSASEWEGLARGPEGRRYAFGDEADAARHAALSSGPAPNLAWNATPEGIADLTASVSEWVRCEKGTYSYCEGGYGHRGGSWKNAEFWRLAFTMTALGKGVSSKCARLDDVGFRCVRTPRIP